MRPIILSDDELEERVSKLLLDIVELNNQLDAYKFSYPQDKKKIEWLEMTKASKSRTLAAFQRELKWRKNDKKEKTEIEKADYFRIAAKRILPENIYLEIVDESIALRADAMEAEK